MDRRMEDRFIVRPDSTGFSVIDTQLGQPAVIAMTRQTGLSEADAAHTAGLLNARAEAA
jgi:hypothetical protein